MTLKLFSILGRINQNMKTGSSLLITVMLLLLMNVGTGQNECREVYCGPDGPPIRFPFHLTNATKSHCGFPGFGLSCTDKSETLLELPAVPFPVKLLVQHIDYHYQKISLYDPQNCLSKQFLKLNHSSLSPFQLGSQLDQTHQIPFFDCSSVAQRYPSGEQGAQDMFPCPIFAAGYDEGVVDLDLVFCTKMFDVVSSVDARLLQMNLLILRWSKPNCNKCEAKGKGCKLKNNGSEDGVECFGGEHKPMKKIPTSIVSATTGVTVGSILLLLVLAAFFQLYRYFRMKGEDQARLEIFLEDYKALKPARFSYADIKKIANHFKDKLGEGAHGAVFKGKLSSEIHVAVKMLSNTEGDGEEFINEVRSMGKIHHVNVVRLLGYCADGFRRALVYDFFPNGSLQKFISPPDNEDVFLGWEKLQQIALGIAKGIEYLHQGCDHRILHFDINPHNVLLDDNFTPKITDFGLAKLCPKNQSTVSLSAARGTLGYIAPEVFSRNFGNVSYKSDIYSYGMLLLEMVGGRKNVGVSSEESLQVLYPEWIHNILDEGNIHIHIEDDGDIKIAQKLAIVGLWCIQWHPVDRPSIKTVIQMLEGERDKLTVPPSPFDSTTSRTTSVIVPSRRLNLELEVIDE